MAKQGTKENAQDWDSLGIAIDRLPTESADAYQAFLQYSWLQFIDRTTKKVAEITGYSPAQTRDWCIANDWVNRALMVDGIKWTREFREREAVLAKDNEKFAEANRSVKEQGLRISRQMLDVAEGMLAKAALNDEVIETDYVIAMDGRKVPTYTTIKMKAKISDIPRLVDTAVKVGRLVQDLPTEIIEYGQEIPIGSDLSNLSYEDLQALQEQNRRALREKGAASKIQLASDLEN